jgi:drug/metabolite transporter (DMT)-like permease
MSSRTLLLTALAMVAFAANSLLCRLALGAGAIDAASFASLRVVSGAATLVVILALRDRRLALPAFQWRMTAALFVYVAFFSFAYLWLSAGTGALLLFGSVQLTMFGVALAGGERFTAFSWAGLAAAIAGLVYLVLPGLSAPDPAGAGLMIVAGIGWGVYSLLGRGAADPLASTAANFLYAVPLVLAVSLALLGSLGVSPYGAALAVASGAITSGCGYVVWYAALRGLTATRAAVVQLSVPAITAFGGVLLLSEPLTARLLVASVVTVGGVAVVLSQRARG